jgi:hypothetical protein
MRRWYKVAALLAGLATTPAYGQYVLIQVYVGGGDSKPSGNDQTTPGGGNGNQPGPGGPGGGLPGGGPGRPGGGGGIGGGLGGGPGRPGGGMGMGGGRPGGGAGVGPGGGGGMGLGGGGGMGLGGGGSPKGPGGTPGNVEFDTVEGYVIVAVELYDKAAQTNDVLGLKQFHSVWGRTALIQDGVNIITANVEVRSPRHLFQDKKRKANDRKDKTSTEFLALAKYALNHGLILECVETMDELAKQPPASGDAHAGTVLAAYAAMKKGLSEPLSKGSAFSAIQKKLPTYGNAQSKEGHYAVFYADPSATVPDEVTRRLELLEQNMLAYYLWFVLQGQTLPMPPEQLVAVMVPDAGNFKIQRAAVDSPPSVSDGFFAKRDNVVVFSMQRLDESFQIFAKYVQAQVWSEGWSRKQLLDGKDVPRDMRKKPNWKDEYKKCQTLALAHKALEHEAELAAVTHEGSLQLAIATGLYPSSVAAPEWASFGFASLFDTPKGPYPGAVGIFKTAFWPGFGAPNWAYMRPFRIWFESKDPLIKLDDPAVALKRTITDVYFQNSRKEVKEEIDSTLPESERRMKQKEIARAKEEQLRARTLAWSLVYYLANYHLDQLMAYFQQLSVMPRDLEMDDQTMLLTFAKACKLTNSAGDAIDQDKFAAFANSWFKKIADETLPGDGPDLPLKARQERSATADSGGPAGPGGPGQPGRP